MTTARALAATVLLSAAVTVAMSWPVAVHPQERIFGVESAGRHHDPFTVMWQFANGRPEFPYRQPLVDDTGALIARATGPVAAYNLIVLLSFPLTALATFLLGRYLRLSPGVAAAAAMAFAFAPPHIAHAAYHPHIAQTQWLPLYFLALWACVDRPSLARAAGVALAAAALAGANLYGAWIAAVMTPLAAAGVWVGKRAGDARRAGAGAAAAAAMAVAIAVVAVGALALGAVLPRIAPEVAALAADPADLLRYGAQWRSYVLPAGGLEQQIALSYALMGLAAVAVWTWVRPRATAGDAPEALRAVPFLSALAIWAAICSLPPVFPGAPSGWLYQAAPMFRAYARFAFVTHLSVALLAGIGFMIVRSRHRGLALALLAIAAIEYMPAPAQSRDVLPTAAHRWIATQPPGIRALDCVQPSQEDALVPWLMQRELGTLPASLPSCAEPNVAQQAASLGYTHLIVRDGAAIPPGVLARQPGLAPARPMDGAALYEIVGDPAPVTVLQMTGFSAMEHDDRGSWRWMGQRGEWIVRNAGPAAVRLQLELELTSFEMPRHVAVDVDDVRSGELIVTPDRARHRTGAFSLPPGVHRVTFIAMEPASRAPGGDPRMLTIRLTDWRWWE